MDELIKDGTIAKNILNVTRCGRVPYCKKEIRGGSEMIHYFTEVEIYNYIKTGKLKILDDTKWMPLN